MIADAGERARALDPEGCFIVDAPAGSGKTELLIQRYLTLLARVRKPEEIVAITFTRKAAGEMRGRIIEALQGATGPEPEKEHERLTWRLAREALQNDRRQAWEIEDNPSRLRIQTIDSLCASITRQMPYLSQFGAQPEIAEHAGDLYREAARNLIRRAPEAARTLIAHLDNRFGKLETLLVEMLGRRDQWLRHVVAGAGRAQLDAYLRSVIRESLGRLRAMIPPPFDRELAAIAGRSVLPGREPEHKPLWDGIAGLLLTGTGTWRKRPDGFPRGAHTLKARAKNLIQMLAAVPGLLEALNELSSLPPAAVTDGQWAVLQALFAVLTEAEAELRVVFAERGAVDFIEVARRAEQALGAEDNPTDLALALDSRIQHLLVDEFQDTSMSQYRLLRLLTAGWQPGDGRTLFVVGDPMQSIYRFREAQVGLFLTARREGIGGVRLEPLRLAVNFRSHAGIVDWVNDAFARVLPAHEDIVTGAIPQSRSVANEAGRDEPAVTLHPLFGNDPRSEARLVAGIIRQVRDDYPEERVAVLVRARTHLPSILAELRRAGLPYRAIEIDALSERPVIQDLLALTRALLRLADRTAWLAVLRAPWCGLTLADLHALAAGSDDAVWELMQDPARVAALSQDGGARLARVRGVLQACLREARRLPLRRWIEGAWTALGGPACLKSDTDLQDAEAFLQLLEGLETGGDIQDFAALAEQVAALYAAPEAAADGKIEVLTIHRAKGLEWETVILPGLGRGAPHQDEPLLRWLEAPAERREPRLLLAPIHAAGEETDPIGAYLAYIEKQRERFECGRLLYVGATRAKRRLHLLGATQAADKLRKPRRNSLLRQLWDVVEPDFERARSEAPAAAAQAEAAPRAPVPIRRLPTGWSLPEAAPAVEWAAGGEEKRQAEPITFEWVGDTLRHVGTVVHRLLQHIAEHGGPEAWDAAAVRGTAPLLEAALAELGVPPDETAAALERALRAVLATLEDAKGRWILAPRAGACCEYAVSGVVNGRVLRGMIDRTFVDADGTRWIVDFKTSAHTGGRPEEFLDHEQERYRRQLEEYAALFARLEEGPIRLGLYFPLLGGWREWEADGSRGKMAANEREGTR